MRRFSFILLFYILIVKISLCTIINVPGDSVTIQGGIYGANTGDTVLVDTGLYHESIDLDKNIVLASKYLLTGDTSYISKTVIIGTNGNYVIKISNSSTDSLFVVGFTIRGGKDGVRPMSRFTIHHCRVINCFDGIDYETPSGGVCRDNIFEYNSDDGIDLDGEVDIIIENNLVRHNGDDGIEIRFHAYSGPLLTYIIRNNVIYDNGEDGIQLIDYPDTSNRVFYFERNLICNNAMAGVGCMSNGKTKETYEGASIPEPIFFINNTIDSNYYGFAGGDNMMFFNNIVSNSTSKGVKKINGNSLVAHCLFWGNGSDFLFSNIDTSTVVFSSPQYSSNYNLQQTSPCIDAGNPGIGCDPDSTILDIGAVHYQQPLSGLIISGPLGITGCVDDTVSFSVSAVTNGNLNYQWKKDGINIIGANDSIFNINSVSLNDSGIYSCLVSSLCNSQSSSNAILSVSSIPNAYAGADTIINFGDSIILTAIGGASFLWSTGDTSSSIVVNPYISTTYSVTVTNNSGCVSTDEVAVTVNVLPDLLIANIETNTPLVSQGSSLTIECKVENRGNMAASQSKIKYYLSSNQILGCCDVYLGSKIVGNISPGGINTVSKTLNIPVSTYSGIYYVICVCDGLNDVVESNEYNNDSAIQISIGSYPDLIVINPSTSTYSITPGANFYTRCWVKNSGNASSNQSKLRYFLSTDQIYDNSDIFLTGITVSGLSAGGKVKKIKSITIPNYVPTGNWYVLFKSDAFHQIAEFDENNNVSYTQIQVNSSVKSQLVSVNEQRNQNRITLYPNPSSGIVNVNFAPEYEVFINATCFDAFGNIIIEIQNIDTRNGDFKLDFTRLNRGVYFVRFINNRELYTEKVIIR